MKSLLEFLLIHLVDNPDAVRVEVTKEGDTDVYTLYVDPQDTGRIIGKNGKIINAIRALARVRAMKERSYILIRVSEQTA